MSHENESLTRITPGALKNCIFILTVDGLNVYTQTKTMVQQQGADILDRLDTTTPVLI